jgi:2-polyprenyl-6-hydroxyphenyl methylase/3-demethylubiquinone-9 3-methyltransferase
MDSELRAICAKRTPCKCCGAAAFPYGVVDFHKNCEIYRTKVLDISGIPIYYHRCPECRFIFTTAFDHFSKEDFLRSVYNDEYLLVDPDYQAARPKVIADFLCNLLSPTRPERILDYGGGEGLLAELLRAGGFSEVQTYDPFVARFSHKPTDRFDCVVCIEVIEHCTEPERVFSELSAALASPGLIILSTVLQPADIDYQGLNWWYAGPRNGHVSLYSRDSLERLAQRYGLTVGSFNESMHVLLRGIPDFAKHFVKNQVP